MRIGSTLLIVLAGAVLATQTTAQSGQQSSSNWRVQRSAANNIFALPNVNAEQVETMSLSCSSGSPILLLSPIGARPQSFQLGLNTTAEKASIRMTRVNDRFWSVKMSDATIVNLLASTAPHADVTIDGQPAGRLTLTGSRSAFINALAPCWKAPVTGSSAQGSR